MDEILIGEKKYVSSKRAAKITGYAKDYVGQLCREGRVPARLVGRSWYVLETAIQDHRFGDDQKIEQEIHSESRVSELKTRNHDSVLPPTWESPHYEASPVNRLRDTEPPSIMDTNDENTVAQHLQDSWRAWFDHVGMNSKQVVPSSSEELEKNEEKENESDVEEEKADMDVNIPIHVVHEPLPEELLPANKDFSYRQQEEVAYPQERIRAGGRLVRVVQIIGTVVAILLVTLAIIGSGYLDKYVVSLKQAGIITGIILYNK